jgi:hypothetical protein
VTAAARLLLLDLSELALDHVMEELSPASLVTMACVYTALRERCSADALWGRHLPLKWGRVLGAAARKGRPRRRWLAVARPTQELGTLACLRPPSAGAQQVADTAAAVEDLQIPVGFAGRSYYTTSSGASGASRRTGSRTAGASAKPSACRRRRACACHT